MLFNIATLTTLALAASSTLTTVSAHKPGQIVQLTSATSWCMMMPPVRGGDIAKNEDRAVAFCTHNSTLAPKARLFPKGFISSAHFAKGDGYVQVTGKIDHTKYGLSDHDQGGQYDMKAPVGSACAGYKSYVNLIEPHSDIFCIRCCKNKEDCNTGKSTKGCKVVVPGDYSDNGPVVSSSSSSSVPATSTNSPVVLSSTSPIEPTSSAQVTTTTTGAVTTPTGNPNAAAAANSAGLLSVAAIGVAALLAL
ncbi:hypothetical protein BG003_010623 [Podila horticola]|nr:hypothetical protein BG003_010623 [Podila horticola]